MSVAGSPGNVLGLAERCLASRRYERVRVYLNGHVYELTNPTDVWTLVWCLNYLGHCYTLEVSE